MMDESRGAISHGAIRSASLLLLLVVGGLLSSPARAERPPSQGDGERAARADGSGRSPTHRVDRVVARWISSATGGASNPQFILARELAFEARVEALAEGFVGAGGYADKHVSAAMRRHVTETMLASLPVNPAPTPAEVAKYAHAAKLMAEQRAGGAARLRASARAEGLDSTELDSIWRRHARASAYLDRMVAPMLEPTDADLREAYDSRSAEEAGLSFTELLPELRRTVVARRLAQALERYFRNAQSRIVLKLIVAG